MSDDCVGVAKTLVGVGQSVSCLSIENLNLQDNFTVDHLVNIKGNRHGLSDALLTRCSFFKVWRL